MPLPGAGKHLTLYLDNAGSHRRLDRDEERERARELVRLRRACWRAALRDRAHRKAFLRIAEAELRGRLREEIKRYWEGILSRDELVAALMLADPDRRILHELERGTAHGIAMEELRIARAAYVEARNRFMCANLRFVVHVASRYGRRYMSLPDRIQEGNLGLLKAIDRFDPERGCRFSTYAAWWIRHAVTEALVRNGRTVRIPAHLHTLFTKARLASLRLQGDGGRCPSLAEIAESVDAPVEALRAAIAAMELRAVSLDEPSADDGMSTVGEWLADETITDWPDRVGERIDARLAEELLCKVDERGLTILKHRFGLHGEEHQTLQALGDRYGLTGERIRQLEKEALAQLRDAVEHSDTASIACA